MLFQRKQPVLARGERTLIRRFTRADVDRWIAWPEHSDPLFGSYNPPALTMQQRDHYFSVRAADSRLLQLSVDDQDGELIGRISLREIDWRNRQAVLGITFHPHRLGNGLGKDAMHALGGYYFGPLAMNRMWLDVAAYNTRAFRCYVKCGFQVCGHHWGPPHPGVEALLALPEHAALRRLFRLQEGRHCPLLIDMVLTEGEYRSVARSAPAERSSLTAVG